MRAEFNLKENKELTEAQGKIEQRSEWMIYNEEFASYYNDYPKQRIKFITIISIALLLYFCSMIFILIFIWLMNKFQKM